MDSIEPTQAVAISRVARNPHNAFVDFEDDKVSPIGLKLASGLLRAKRLDPSHPECSAYCCSQLGVRDQTGSLLRCLGYQPPDLGRPFFLQV